MIRQLTHPKSYGPFPARAPSGPQWFASPIRTFQSLGSLGGRHSLQRLRLCRGRLQSGSRAVLGWVTASAGSMGVFFGTGFRVAFWRGGSRFKGEAQPCSEIEMRSRARHDGIGWPLGVGGQPRCMDWDTVHWDGG